MKACCESFLSPLVIDHTPTKRLLSRNRVNDLRQVRHQLKVLLTQMSCGSRPRMEVPTRDPLSLFITIR